MPIFVKQWKSEKKFGENCLNRLFFFAEYIQENCRLSNWIWKKFSKQFLLVILNKQWNSVLYKIVSVEFGGKELEEKTA